MKRNVTIAGAKYTGVPSILIPLTDEAGNATFCEVSDTTATAADVATGKTFYNAAGTLTTGTATGGSGTADPGFTVNLTQTEGQTINYTSLDSKITATAGTMSIKPGSFTANFDIVPDKGYDAGNLSVISHTFQNWGESITVTADPAVKSVENKFTFSKKDQNSEKALTWTIHGKEYTFKSMIGGTSFFRIMPYYDDYICFADRSLMVRGNPVYTYFMNHALKISDSSGNWVIQLVKGKPRDTYNGMYVDYDHNTSDSRRTSDSNISVYSMTSKLSNKYDNGETLTFEFVEWDK